ncbi:DUF3604 domain-containing protein [Parahaliea maris]|uniref:DUF3604 domain-containing protein n=1 Tax=Parahaliea maris TaxID=2716870 RepID=A0A5C8ZWR7_9GAMM|nr:DUF3604 domain-containing protein [Parahaliea maris]TXS92955.1 DUF3604 domain-containing protein [Parahaliea maris]
MNWMSLRPAAAALTMLVALSPATGQATDPLPTQVYWGDTHLHTSNSFDVYLFNTPTSTPDTALRFARGLPVVSPTTQVRWQLNTPLDFAVVADHAELVGSIVRLFEGDPAIANTNAGKALARVGGQRTEEELQAVYDEIVRLGSGLPSESGLTAPELVADMHAGDKRRPTWEANIDTVERHDTPGEFTAFIGWEWSAQPKVGNLHRVVFTPQGGDVARQFLPYSSLESGDPQDLWAWLEETSARTGADFVAIPHNGNISMGQMFPLVDQSGDPLDAEYARAREKWERVIEITQIKGDSETHPLLSPTDEFADFETFPFVLTPDGRTPDPTEGDYVRAGLKRGLAWEEQLGTNPFKVGVIGSTDSHTGMSAVEEDNFAGKGQHDSRPGLRPHLTGIGGSRGWDMGAAGYAGVWATENTRQAIFDAFMRREVYATTGPRITLRFFGGFEFDATDTQAQDLAAVGYAKGVPMGGDLKGEKSKTPTFLLAAMKDPNGANLDRLQIVKGWLKADGSTAETVYDVVLSGGRDDGAELVGNTVDLETGEYTNTIGATGFTTVWTDPDFDPAQRAFYYARVLEIPTPRYSLLDAIALGIDIEETGHPPTIQERVYSSPIWYTP